jgi:hypothetical protein
MEDASMRKTPRVRLIAVLIFCSAISLPGLSYAQQQQIDSGTWIGVETYYSTVYNSNQMIIGEASGSNLPSTFTLEFNPDFPISPSDPQIVGIGMSIGSFSIPFTSFNSQIQSYDPQNLSGSMNIDMYHQYYDNGNFDVTFQAILPDGTIDTTGGYADVGMHIVDVNPITGVTTDTVVGFQSVDPPSVPEPASLVLAALAILIVSIFAWMRGFTVR